MDWMYKGVSGHVDREDYLTGRKIDKSFEMLDSEENPKLHQNDDEFRLPNIASSSSTALNDNLEQSIMNMSKADIMAKMHEDPLFQIKMKQWEKRKELLKNPLKLKKLKNLLQSSLAKEEKSKKRKKKRKSTDKKKKKHRKHRTKHSSTSSSSSSSSSSESESSDSESDSRSKKSRHHHHNRDHKNNHHNKDKHQNDRNHSKQKSSIESFKHRSDNNNRYRSNQQSIPPPSSKNKSKLTEEELEKKRKEMMSNAEWREQTRNEKVIKLNERDRLEDHLAKESFRKQKNDDSDDDSDDDNQKHGGKNPNFIRTMLTKMADTNTVERSVRQKRFQSQRDHQAMDRNFARKT
ncbi:RNA-splicing factor [Dermatophagoides pteronyssinus]|uniref:RNA-splicing factor n=1 Tax=Dermatophagoides pteronyssinus TaxID=6956 RepID=A0ABQ8IU13_DERPT|nr:RNA-splicing factor [Dermatophagoides pteronyssinus]